MRAVAKVNVIGPDGQHVAKGADIPAEWPTEFVEALVTTGGARKKPAKKTARSRKPRR